MRESWGEGGEEGAGQRGSERAGHGWGEAAGMWVRNRSKFCIEGNTLGREKSYWFSTKTAVWTWVGTRRKKESVRKYLLHMEVTLSFVCRLFLKVPELEAPLDTSQASTSVAAHTVHWALHIWIVYWIIYHCLYLLGSHMCLSFCVWEVANEWIWSPRQCSPLCSMYKFHRAGAQPCQPCCLWSQKHCRCDPECSITNIKLVCCIKLESYLPYCEGVCQSALKIMHCKLKLTELMKCPQGGYDDPLKERALSDNLSNFEKKKFQFFFSFFQNAANVSFFVIWGWENTDASFLFQSLSCCQGLCCCGQVLSLSQHEVTSCPAVELGQGLAWAAAPCAEVCAGSSHPLTPSQSLPQPCAMS